MRAVDLTALRHTDHGLSPTCARFEHVRDGRVLWMSGVGEIEIPRGGPEHLGLLAAQPWQDNALLDEGEQLMLDSFFRAASLTANFYLALLTATPAETATMATMSEVTGTGYARIAMVRGTSDFPTLALNGGDYQVTTLQKTFTATGTWTAATDLALVTVVSGTAGKLIATTALSTTRTLVNGDTLNVTLAVKLQ